ncbi:WD repeat-containing protein 6 [Coemansia sp. Benny D115]|nr:WD repeat-containing protein 6 [Coemansia sp. Benny D115]
MESRLCRLPVTAVEFIDDNCFLAGSGSSLLLYDARQPSHPLCEIQALQLARRVYGIVPLKAQALHDRTVTGDPLEVVAFGSKSWTPVRIIRSNDNAVALESRQQCCFETPDWIKAAHWVWHSDRWLVALVLAHNQLLLCCPNTGATVYAAQCQEHCILYAAALYGQTIDDLVVASGTVFNQVLVWRPVFTTTSTLPCSDVRDSDIAMRLVAHAGVVFGVRFSRDGRQLASVSDDRSLCLWDISTVAGPETHSQPLCTLYGHQARIWTCLILRNHLISASEDGTCRVWDALSGEPVDSWRQCKKNVWALAANPSETLVVSGAGDGSICLWSMQAMQGRRLESYDQLDIELIPEQKLYLPSEGVIQRPTEHIRGFSLISHRDSGESLICVMDSGCILKKATKGSSWVLWRYAPLITGYSMVTTSLHGGLTAIGMRDGSVMLIADLSVEPSVVRIHLQSVRHLVIVETQPRSCTKDTDMESTTYDLITADSLQQVVWSQVVVTGSLIRVAIIAVLQLPPGAQFSTASVNKQLGWAFVGSINGGLYVYHLPAGNSEILIEGYRYSAPDSWPISTAAAVDTTAAVPLEPSVVWNRVHGKFTLSAIYIKYEPDYNEPALVETEAKHCTVLTGGRDGILNTFTLLTYKSHGQSKAAGGYVWLREGISSLDIRCAAATEMPLSGELGSTRLVAMGGEDCTLRIFDYNANASPSLRMLTHATKHSSTIRCVKFVKVNSRTTCSGNGTRYLITAGGGCEMRCWRLDTDTSSGTSIIEWAVAPFLDHSYESRIMDLVIVDQSTASANNGSDIGDSVLLVAAAYSDASICLWRLDISRQEFTCIAYDPRRVHNHCILSLAAVDWNNAGDRRNLLLSGATDGRAMLWDLTRYVQTYTDQTDTANFSAYENSVSFLPAKVIDHVHQSGVNTLSALVTSDLQLVFASGGDDNSLAVCVLDLEKTPTNGGLILGETRMCTYASAHASSVQAVEFTADDTLCTVATDQRIATWKIHGLSLPDSEDILRIEMQDMTCTQVADPSAMALINMSAANNGELHHSNSNSHSHSDYCAMVVGIGVEVISL